MAGGGEKAADAPATECALREPFGVEFLANGSMVIVEMERGNRVRRVDARGTLSVLAGTGAKGFAGDGGPARDAALNRPAGLALDGRDGIERRYWRQDDAGKWEQAA